MACGTVLERRCPSCGEIVPPEARFCPACGSAIETGPAPAGPPPRRAEVPAEERRQVTVLFADLSGYTAVAERMDPEAVKAMVERCLRRLGDEVLFLHQGRLVERAPVDRFFSKPASPEAAAFIKGELPWV